MIPGENSCTWPTSSTARARSRAGSLSAVSSGTTTRSCATRCCASVVGEAASCLSDDVRGRLPDIPWREIRGFRNIAVHAYFSLDWDVVHEVATVNLPDMAPKVLALLRTEDPEIAARFDTDDGGRGR